MDFGVMPGDVRGKAVNGLRHPRGTWSTLLVRHIRTTSVQTHATW
jgi:hypothetical protein